jgi:hypothetical protein
MGWGVNAARGREWPGESLRKHWVVEVAFSEGKHTERVKLADSRRNAIWTTDHLVKVAMLHVAKGIFVQEELEELCELRKWVTEVVQVVSVEV